MENGPHEEAKFDAEETGEEVSDLLSAHSPDKDYEEAASRSELDTAKENPPW